MTILRAKADLKVMHDPPKRSDVGIAVSEYEDDRRRRIQVTRVFRRPDHVIDFEADLGPWTDAPNQQPIFILGSIDMSDPDTVGTLWDEAETERNNTGLADFLAARSAESTLITDAIRAEEQVMEFAKRYPRSIAGLKELNRG